MCVCSSAGVCPQLVFSFSLFLNAHFVPQSNLKDANMIKNVKCVCAAGWHQVKGVDKKKLK